MCGREGDGIDAVRRPVLTSQYRSRFCIEAGGDVRSLGFPLIAEHPLGEVGHG